jgi:hypothetical protein
VVTLPVVGSISKNFRCRDWISFNFLIAGPSELRLVVVVDVVGSGKDYSQHPVLAKRVSTASRSAKSISAKHPSRI